ncbi:MAG: diguanylate cyclase domain-containing protein [Nocardioidaceae bacterium]
MARQRAYRLIEAAQGEGHLLALEELRGLRASAESSGWPEAAFLAGVGEAVYGLVHGWDGTTVGQLLDDLVDEGERTSPASLLAVALGFRAVHASTVGNHDALFTDAGRALAIVDDERLPAQDRCRALVACAGAYNVTGLWELGDELYDRAAAVAATCNQPVQASAIAVNRVLVRMEWATALLEVDEEQEAVRQLVRAAAAIGLARSAPGLPSLWRLDIEACSDLLTLVRFAFGDIAREGDEFPVDHHLRLIADHRATLLRADDQEMLPLLDGFTALSLLRLGRVEEATRAVGSLAGSGETIAMGSRTFPQWVRAKVLAGLAPGEDVSAVADYALTVARARWSARQGVLAAARSRIAGERIRADHARLSRDVLLDPLTGLANRRAFEAWMAQVPAEDRPTALLLMDLDFFKHDNDVHGHAVGDEVLRVIGRLLSESTRAEDLALRLGGDEFAVLLEVPDRGAPASADVALEGLRRAARRLSRTLQGMVAARDWNEIATGLSVGVSIGFAVAVLGPRDADGASTLYREADTMLYAAKETRTPAPEDSRS